MNNDQNVLARAGTAIGIGLMAGLAGTAAMTFAQWIDMKITGRKPSATPVKVASKVLDINPTSEETKAKVSNEIHWAYGTSWGMARGGLRLTGLKGWEATAVHFIMVWGAENIMLPALKVSPPITKWPAKEIAKDGMFHAVYAVAAGLVYDAIDCNKKD